MINNVRSIQRIIPSEVDLVKNNINRNFHDAFQQKRGQNRIKNSETTGKA